MVLCGVSCAALGNKCLELLLLPAGLALNCGLFEPAVKVFRYRVMSYGGSSLH